MPADIDTTPEWKRSWEYFHNIHGPALNSISGASDLHVSPCGKYVAFTGSTWKGLAGGPISRVCVASITGKSLKVLPNTNADSHDKSPRWSPDGRTLAFLSDRQHKEKFATYRFRVASGVIQDETPSRLIEDVDGSVDYVEWSPSGDQLLLLSSDDDGDNEPSHQPRETKRSSDPAQSWKPTIRTAVSPRRSVSVYSVADGRLRRHVSHGLTVWEACWCGEDTLACIVSDGCTENDWYLARLSLLSLATEVEQVLHRSSVQLGVPACSPSGDRIAVVEALCSDRGAVAGNILVISRRSGIKEYVTSEDTDATHMTWRDEKTLFFIGLKGLHISAGDVNVESGIAENIWSCQESCGVVYPKAAPIEGPASFTLILENWDRYPELCMVRHGQVHRVLSFEHSGNTWQRAQLGAVIERSWKSSDGLEIQGYLYLPARGQPPYPLILSCHGGPVWAFRNRWPGNLYLAFLVSQGYAVLTVNQRGSSGRGQEFAKLALGDPGGQEIFDFLSGITALVQEGTADVDRLGVTGVSYGGYMAAWLIAQDRRFKASVPVAAVTDWRSFHLESNIALQPQLFMKADPYGKGGLYHERSPTMAADRVRTPVFQVAGGQDLCVPSSQASQLHQALLEHQIPSALAVYPEEGHGIAKFPALIDFCARTLLWFNHYLLENVENEPRPKDNFDSFSGE